MTRKSGSVRSWTTLRRASPASNRPVHWMMTTGRRPPRISPAATASASPSRQTRISGSSGVACSAASQVPSSESGIQTAWVTPHSLSTATTDGPSSIANPSPPKAALASLLVGPVAGHARAGQLGTGGQGRLLVLLLGGVVHGLGVVEIRRGQLGPGLPVPARRLVLGQGR